MQSSSTVQPYVLTNQQPEGERLDQLFSYLIKMAAEVAEHNFTCNTCGLSFAAADYQREHMKTDWHRYNLKRRVADLPPIPAEVFAEKMVQQSTSLNNVEQRDNSRRQVTKKDLKRLEQQRRRQAAAATRSDTDSIHSRASSVVSGVSHLSLGEPSRDYVSDDLASDSASEADFEDEIDQVLRQKQANAVEIPANVCFMDGREFANVEENLAYLESHYGLVVPQPRFLASPKGLVEYLNEKIGLGNCCLSCSYMGRSLEAARAHMLGKGHVKIPFDTEEQQEELADFYDFEEWSDVSDEENDNGEASTAEDTSRTGNEEVYANGYELVLGNGRTAGHRSLARYYKQRLDFEAAKPEGIKAVRLIDNRSQGISDRAADKMVKSSWRSQKRDESQRAKGRRMQNFKSHFRDPLLQ